MLLTSNNLRHYQRFLKSKFTELERSYYEHIDDLTQKLGDLDLPGLDTKDLPDFTLTQFTFISQWEDGNLSSEEVADIFQKMNNQDHYRLAARAKLIKPLQKFMIEREVFSDFVKHTIAAIEIDVVPKMIKYLEMMDKTFNVMSGIDKHQIPITWVEQSINSGQISLKYEELSLNQAIRQIDSYIVHVTDQKFFVKDQIVIFDQIESIDERTIHWLFAPRTYIDLLKVLYEIKYDLKGESEEQYLKNLLESIA